MSDIKYRKHLLKHFGAGPVEIRELLEYTHSSFDHSHLKKIKLPLPREPHTSFWKEYLEDSKKGGVFKALRKHLPQLRFPIRKGIAASEAYRDVTLRGKPVSGVKEATGLDIHEPEDIKLLIHQSAAGPIPVLIIENRKDFVTILRALAMRNEPKEVPDSMGACMVKGYINWERIHDYREEWESSEKGKPSEADWKKEFQRLIPQKHLYQDRFMLVSTGPYSNIPASEVEMDEDKWGEISASIRIHHECAHYFTLRVFNSMRNNLHDEIIADFMGIRGAIGTYRADWFYHFMGIEDYPRYREGGRMENYCKDLSPESFKVMQGVLKNAAWSLELFDSKIASGPGDIHEQARLILTLSSLTLEEMASEDGVERLRAAYKKYKR